MTNRRDAFRFASIGFLGALFAGRGAASSADETTNLDKEFPLRALELRSKRHDPFPVAEPYRGIYAHGVEVLPKSRTLHVSGQVGVAPDGFVDTSFGGQGRQAFRNLLAVLEAAGMTKDDIVKLTFYLTRRSDMDELLDVRREFVDGVRPAVTTLFIDSLVSKDWLIEIEAFAARPPGPSGIGLGVY